MTKREREKKKPSLALQYGLTGAGLGLYLGYFFRPMRNPSLQVALSLAIGAALVMMLVRLFRKPRLAPVALARYGGVQFLRFGLLMLVLEGRHVVLAFGGRPAVLLFTTVAGVLAGLWYHSQLER